MKPSSIFFRLFIAAAVITYLAQNDVRRVVTLALFCAGAALVLTFARKQ